MFFTISNKIGHKPKQGFYLEKNMFQTKNFRYEVVKESPFVLIQAKNIFSLVPHIISSSCVVVGYFESERNLVMN
jgi:hypothetical protein